MTDQANDSPPVPSLIHCFNVEAEVAPPVEAGESAFGLRRILPITGGRAYGPKLEGKILPGGADFQLIRKDLTAEIQARYIIETPSGARVYVENTGIRRGPPELIAKLIRGERVDPALIYFRAAPKFETAAPELAWMMEHLFICSGARLPGGVQLAFYMVT